MNSNWNLLTNISQLDSLLSGSFQKPVLIFKHSTRCSISSMALDRFNRSLATQTATQVDLYYLDLLTYRDVSNEIALRLGIAHESPQVLLIQNGICSFSETHQDIRLEHSLQNIGTKN